MFKSDPSLDFHNKLIRSVATGEQCPHKDQAVAYILTTPLGNVYTNASPAGLHCVRLYGDTDYDNINWDAKVDYIRASSLLGTNKHVNQLKKWLQMYFENAPKCVNIPLEFCCLEKYGEFNSMVWTALHESCPPGELISYSELAEKCGRTFGASKVIGWAINKNPFSLVIGDHRVVKANGEIMVCDDSQRNKLRRLLVEHEMSFTSGDVEAELARVRNRHAKSASTRKRAPSSVVKSKDKPARKSKAKTKTKGRRKSRNKWSESEEEEDNEMSSDEQDDDDDLIDRNEPDNEIDYKPKVEPVNDTVQEQQHYDDEEDQAEDQELDDVKPKVRLTKAKGKSRASPIETKANRRSAQKKRASRSPSRSKSPTLSRSKSKSRSPSPNRGPGVRRSTRKRS